MNFQSSKDVLRSSEDSCDEIESLLSLFLGAGCITWLQSI